ncbi:SWI/SNF-related matrix-associated actin-dependent regulator of chromatin subfamily E member 1-like isoform X2 [Heptranchias perlo]|uniref:SWI/SNF-related matrix-associated actin-dependent regulator of chromatin subfamily E member 1-like isoform X2 n=1 Tax=Heptranchias perlo TaxID=212740 RepID=UPI00355A00A0
MDLEAEEMDASSGISGAGGPQAVPRAEFTLSPFAAQLSRKVAAIVRSGSGGRGGGGGSGDVTAYSGSGASRDSATYIESVPVTVSLENVDGQHRIVCVTTDANGGTLSYVGQLNSDVNLELQAAVSPQPLLQRDGVSAISTGNPLLQIHPLDAGSQQLQNVILEGQVEGSSGTKEMENDEPKKRKGGWPKGKKRKPPKDFTAPRAPTTGYVLFLNEQRAKLKIEHPDLPFTEITKLLGTQWSQLSQEGKQKYINEAEKDKRRYIEELKAYQNSEAYQAFLKRRAINKVKNLCGVQSLDTEFESEAVALSEMGDEDNNGLYCKTCNQYFSSLHNKKEHLFGRQHLQNLTGDFEKEAAELSKQQQEQQQGDEDSADDADTAELSQLCGLTSKHNYTSLNLSLLEEYIFKQVKLREFELGELAKSLEHAQDEQENLNKQLEGLKNRKIKLETDLANLKAYGASLDAQLESLKMVPMLFQFHIQIMDNGNCIRQKPCLSLDTLMK